MTPAIEDFLEYFWARQKAVKREEWWYDGLPAEEEEEVPGSPDIQSQIRSRQTNFLLYCSAV